MLIAERLQPGFRILGARHFLFTLMPLTHKKGSIRKPDVHRLSTKPSGLARQIGANVSTLLEHLAPADKLRPLQGRCRTGSLSVISGPKKKVHCAGTDALLQELSS